LERWNKKIHCSKPNPAVNHVRDRAPTSEIEAALV
jgi:hypothetical protein